MTNEKLLHYIEIITSDLQGRYQVDGETATEAVYRAFANVWDKDYDPQAFFQYFRVAAKNELVHMFRHEKKYDFDREVDLAEELVYQDQDAARGPEDLDRIAERLPKVYVELFELLREGIDHREIANRLNKSHGAIRVMKTRMIQYCQAVFAAMVILVFLPAAAISQPLDSMEIVRKAGSMYYIMVGEDTVATRRDFHKVPGDLEYYAQRANGQKVWYQYTEVGELEYSYVDSARITVVDTTNAESIALRNVRWQHQQAPDSLNYRIVLTADSWADSVQVGWFAADSLTHIDNKTTLYPQGALYDTLESDFKGKIQVTIDAFWEGWVIRDSLLIDMGFISSLGTKKKDDIMPLVAGVDAEFDARSGVTSSGGAVTSWAAVTGGWTLTVPTGEGSPSDNVDTLNGTPVLTFDGNDDALSTSEAGYDRSDTITTHLVIRIPDAGSFDYIIDGGDLNDNSVYYDSGVIWGRRGGTAWGGVTYPQGEWMVLTVVFNNSGNEKIFINGTKEFDAEGNSIGAVVGMWLGDRGGGSALNGAFDVAHVVEYLGEALSDADIQSNVSFLQSEWGLGGGGTTSLSGSSTTTTASATGVGSQKMLSGQSLNDAASQANILQQSSVTAASITDASGDALLSVLSALAGSSLTQSQSDALLGSLKSISGGSLTESQQQAALGSLKSLSGQSVTSSSGSALLEVLGNVVRISGTSTTQASSQASTVLQVAVGGQSTTEASSQASAKVTIAVRGDSITIVGGDAALKMATALSGESITTSTGAAVLTQKGQLFLGTIALTDEPLYKIELQAQPFYNIQLQQQELYTITLEIE